MFPSFYISPEAHREIVPQGFENPKIKGQIYANAFHSISIHRQKTSFIGRKQIPDQRGSSHSSLQTKKYICMPSRWDGEKLQEIIFRTREDAVCKWLHGKQLRKDCSEVQILLLFNRKPRDTCSGSINGAKIWQIYSVQARAKNYPYFWKYMQNEGKSLSFLCKLQGGELWGPFY